MFMCIFLEQECIPVDPAVAISEGGVCTQESVCLGGYVCPGDVCQGGCTPPPCGQTPVKHNLSSTSVADGNKTKSSQIGSLVNILIACWLTPRLNLRNSLLLPPFHHCVVFGPTFSFCGEATYTEELHADVRNWLCFESHWSHSQLWLC